MQNRTITELFDKLYEIKHARGMMLLEDFGKHLAVGNAGIQGVPPKAYVSCLLLVCSIVLLHGEGHEQFYTPNLF